MPVSKRVQSLDVMRAMAVWCFIFWHAFDMFYYGNKYDEPVFRMLILTRVSFVMVSATVLGLKNWSNYRAYDHLKRSLKLISYPVIVGMIKSVQGGTIDPIIQILKYPIGGDDNFTFSILIVLGIIYIILPFVLQRKLVSIFILFLCFVVAFGDLMKLVSVSPFWQFMIVGIIFGEIAKWMVSSFEDNSNRIAFSVFSLCGLCGFLLILLSVDNYWIIRNHVILMVAMVFFCWALVAKIVSQKFMKSILGILFPFSQHSLFVYLFHYVLYVAMGFIVYSQDCNVLCVVVISSITIFVFGISLKYIKGVFFISKMLA